MDSLPWAGDFYDYNSAPHPAFLTFYILTFGWLGVVLFFVISGFCIHLSFLKWEQKTSAKAGTQRFVGQFYFRRFWRIYPVYLVALLFFTIVRVTNLWSWRAIKMVAIHAALLHNFNFGHFFAINGAFWSIAVECQLYLVYPLVILCRRYAGAAIAFTGLALFAFFYPALVPKMTASEPLRFALGQMPFSYWPQWLIGAWVAERWIARRPPIPFSRVCIYLSIIAYVGMSQYRPLSGWSVDLIIVLFALILEAFIWNSKPLTKLEKLLVPVGLSSYSIYLFHGIMFEVFDWVHQHVYRPSPYFDFVVALPVVFLIILLPCWLSYRFIELGSIRLGNWLWGKTHQRRMDQSAAPSILPAPGPGVAEEAL